MRSQHRTKENKHLKLKAWEGLRSGRSLSCVIHNNNERDPKRDKYKWGTEIWKLLV